MDYIRMGENKMHVETLVGKVLRKWLLLFGRLRRDSSMILALPSSMFTVPPCLTHSETLQIFHTMYLFYMFFFSTYSVMYDCFCLLNCSIMLH